MRSKSIHHLNTKAEILSEGIRNIDTRLDVISIMKKLREIDKLKAILLDPDQHLLFSNFPRPEIRPSRIKRGDSKISFSHGLLKKTAFLDQGGTGRQVSDAYTRLKVKPKKTKIDERLISVFKDKMS